MLARTILVSVLALSAAPAAAYGQRSRQYLPADSLSPEELVRQWEEDASRLAAIERPAGSAARAGGIGSALGDYRSNPARAEAVRDELEKVAFRSSIPEVQSMAIRMLTFGYRVNNPESRAESADTRALALRLERIYMSIDGVLAKYAVFGAVSSLGGSGRLYALTWLEPLIVQETEAQSFFKEALRAMQTAASLGRPGRALVVRLRDQGLIKDFETRFRAGFVTVEGG